MTPVRTLAHALLGSVFVAAGTQALLRPQRYAERAAPVTDRLSPALGKVDDRLSTSTETLIRINGAIQVGGGLLLARGKAVRPAATALAGSLIPGTIVGRPPWRTAGKVARQDELVHYVKNLGLLGGLLLAAVDTQGKPGLPWRIRRLYTDTTKSVKRATHTASREAKLVARATQVGRHLPS